MRRNLKKVHLNLPNEESLDHPQRFTNKENLPVKTFIHTDSGRFFTFSKDELEKEKSVSQTDEDDIEKIVEETKKRESRLKQQLVMLKEQTLAAIADSRENYEEISQIENSNIKSQMDRYQMDLSSVKDTMENILQFTKQTQNEIQKTRDMVSTIHETTPNKCISIKDDFGDENGEYSAIEEPMSIIFII